MDVRKAVKDLAAWPESGHFVISLYLNTRWSDEQQREKVRIFVKDEMKELEREHSSRKARWSAMREDVEWLREYVDGLVAQHYDKDYDGIALFACGREGLRTVIRSRIPFRNACYAAPRPRIRPLVHLYDEYETAVFADVGTSDAQIWLISAGEVDTRLEIENEVHGRHRQGGWSQSRFERGIDEQMDHHHREVAEQLERIVNRHGVRNVVLSGTDHVVANFRRFLHPYIDSQMIATINLDRNPGRDAVVRATVEKLREVEREREDEIVRKVLELRANSGRAAVGLEPVLDALTTGRVHRLLIAEDFDMEGFRCLACGKLGEQPPESCELCGEPVIPANLAEEMVVAAIQRGGEVDEIVAHSEFDEIGGVAALLRY